MAHAERKFVNETALQYIRQAAEACADYSSTGQDLSSLQSLGFKKSRRFWSKSVKVPNLLIGKLHVTASIKRNACTVSISNAHRADGKTLLDETADAYVRKGFTKKSRPVSSHISKTYLLKGSQAFDVNGQLRRQNGVQSASVTIRPEC